MRRWFWPVLALGLAAGVVADAPHRHDARALARAVGRGPTAAARAAPQETPIIDPLPVLRPAYLPFAVRAYDPQLPEPLSSTVRGYVHSLRAVGLERCAPATHVLLDRPEGRPEARALAVLRAPRRGPNLDFYVGRFVELSGLLGFAPAACSILTDWLIDVASITVIELPPGTAR